MYWLLVFDLWSNNSREGSIDKLIAADISACKALASIHHILQKNTINMTMTGTPDQARWLSTTLVYSTYQCGSGSSANDLCSYIWYYEWMTVKTRPRSKIDFALTKQTVSLRLAWIQPSPRAANSRKRRLKALGVNAVQWRHYPFALIHATGKTRFSTVKQRNKYVLMCNVLFQKFLSTKVLRGTFPANKMECCLPLIYLFLTFTFTLHIFAPLDSTQTKNSSFEGVCILLTILPLGTPTRVFCQMVLVF